MRIFLRDHKLRTSGWRENLAKAFDLKEFADDDTTDLIENDGDEFTIVFLHTDDSATKDDWLEDVKKGDIDTLVIVNSGGNADKKDSAENVYPCFWKAKEFVSHERPRTLIQQIKCDDPTKIAWDLLQPDDSDAFFAAKLICDAGELCGGSEEVLIDGIIIRRPDENLISKALAVLGARKVGSGVDAAIGEFKKQLEESGG